MGNQAATGTLQQELESRLPEWAREFGFDKAGVASLALDEDLDWLQKWLDAGRHAGMAWIARDPEMRATPAQLQPGTVSVISLRMPCNPPGTAKAEEVLADGKKAYIARYALGRDYHKLIRKRLAKLAQRISDTISPHGYRVLTDSAPSLEKALARNAGLGWFGKHTLCIDHEVGSSFLLGEIYTDLPLQPTATPKPAGHGCGKCTACIDVCPTGAIVAPYELDAGRCISYLTIEHKGSIPEDMRRLIGNRIFGCDDCQLVCPWNRHAQPSREADFAPRHGLERARLVDLFGWDYSTWDERTRGMPLRRTGYRNWLRNLAVALGNAPPDAEIDAALATRADDTDEIVREHVRWAQQQRASGKAVLQGRNA